MKVTCPVLRLRGQACRWLYQIMDRLRTSLSQAVRTSRIEIENALYKMPEVSVPRQCASMTNGVKSQWLIEIAQGATPTRDQVVEHRRQHGQV